MAGMDIKKTMTMSAIGERDGISGSAFPLGFGNHFPAQLLARPA